MRNRSVVAHPLRFHAQCFEAFRDPGRVVIPPADDPAPLDYARALMAAPSPNAAVIFLGRLLPRREAACVGGAVRPRAMLGGSADASRPCARSRSACGLARAKEGRDDSVRSLRWARCEAPRRLGSPTPRVACQRRLTGPDEGPMPAPPGPCAMRARTDDHAGSLRRRPARRRRRGEGLRGSQAFASPERRRRKVRLQLGRAEGLASSRSCCLQGPGCSTGRRNTFSRVLATVELMAVPTVSTSMQIGKVRGVLEHLLLELAEQPGDGC